MSTDAPEVIATFIDDERSTVTITDMGRQNADSSSRIKYVFERDGEPLGEIWGGMPLPMSSLIDSAFEFLDEAGERS